MKHGFLPRLESMRGIAAMIVAIYHFGIVIGGQRMVAFDAASQSAFEGFSVRAFFAMFNGFGAVVFFFALSGYVLTLALERAEAPAGRVAIQFGISRVFRLYPAGIVAVAIFVLVHFVFGVSIYPAPYDLENILLNMLIIHYDITGVMWSLKVELVGAPLVLCCFLLKRRYGSRPLLLLLALTIGLSFWTPFFTILGPSSNLAPLHAFVLGALVRYHGEDIARGLRMRGGGFAFLLALAVFCLCRPLLGLSPRTILCESLAAGVMVLVIVERPLASYLSILDLRFVRFVGRVSFSFYLLHPLTMGISDTLRPVLQNLGAAGIPLIVSVVAMATFSVLLALPFAWLMWRFVEKPGVALGRLLVQGSARVAPVQAISG